MSFALAGDYIRKVVVRSKARFPLSSHNLLVELGRHNHVPDYVPGVQLLVS